MARIAVPSQAANGRHTTESNRSKSLMPNWVGWVFAGSTTLLLLLVALGQRDMRWAATYKDVFKRAQIIGTAMSGGAETAPGWDSPGETDFFYPAEAEVAPTWVNGTNLEIVVAHQAGRSLDKAQADLAKLLNLTAVASRRPKVTVYVKSGGAKAQEGQPPPNLTEIVNNEAAQLTSRWQFAPGLTVNVLDFVGGDAHSFLTHMRKQYDSLAPHTLFFSTQYHFDDAFLRLERLLLPQTGFLGLSDPNFCSCVHGCDFKGTLMGLRDMYHFMSRRFCHLEAGEAFTHFLRNQFVVSARRVRSRPTKFYDQMLQLLGADMLPREDAIYLAQEADRKHFDNPADPLFNQVMQRAWGLAFYCWNATVAASCRCLSDLPQPVCNPAQCQCLDDPPSRRLRNGFFPLPQIVSAAA